MKSYLVIILLLSFLFVGCSEQKSTTSDEGAISYPETAVVDTVDEYFGVKVNDPYRWLEDDNSEETKSWVTSQNKLTHDYLSAIPFRENIKNRLEEVWNYKKVYAPSHHGEYVYFYKNDGLQNQNVYFRKKADGSNEEIFLDPNQFSDDGTVSLSSTSFSSDGSLVVLQISEGGSDWRKGVVLNTSDKSQVGDTLRYLKFTSIAWKGNEGFYYAQFDKPEKGKELTAQGENHKVVYHQLGTSQDDDKVIFTNENPHGYVFVSITENERYLTLGAAESTSGHTLFVKDMNSPESELITLVDHNRNDHSVIGTKGETLIVSTNLDAPNSRVVSVDLSKPTPENWVDLIPETENVLTAQTGGGKIFASYMIDARSNVKQYDYDGNLEKEIELPGIGTAARFGGKESEEDIYYYFTSFTYPTSVFKYNVTEGESELYFQPELAIDLDQFETKQVFYESKDGTKVPMFIVHKKGLELNGKNPTYLYGYGGFDISLTPSFNSARLVWLENGGIYAQPNLRGGGEYGKEWHLAGTKMKKQNVFDDFIAAAEYLISNQYTSSPYLAIAGGSNGGLLVGATMTQRPDLFQVALPAVGVMDMLRYHKFTAGAAWAYDYGTSEDSKEMFDYLHGYSPVHSIKPETSYPATLVTTADHDDRVVPAHSFKFAATLQKNHSGNTPVLIRIETDAGHGAGKPTSKYIEELADIYSFTWYNMGIIPFKNEM